MAKSKKSAVLAPGKRAYEVALEAIEEKYDEYIAGEAEDEDYTPGKQKKIGKALAKLHNRLLKKAKLDGRDELDEEAD